MEQDEKTNSQEIHIQLYANEIFRDQQWALSSASVVVVYDNVSRWTRHIENTESEVACILLCRATHIRQCARVCVCNGQLCITVRMQKIIMNFAAKAISSISVHCVAISHSPKKYALRCDNKVKYFDIWLHIGARHPVFAALARRIVFSFSLKRSTICDQHWAVYTDTHKLASITSTAWWYLWCRWMASLQSRHSLYTPFRMCHSV